DTHLRVDVPEDRRPVEEARVEALARSDLAAGEQAGALVRPDLRVRVDLLQRLAVDDGTDVRVGLPPRSQAEPLGCGDEPRLQVVVDPAVDDHAAGRGAALARGPERRPDDSLDGEVEV